MIFQHIPASASADGKQTSKAAFSSPRSRIWELWGLRLVLFLSSWSDLCLQRGRAAPELQNTGRGEKTLRWDTESQGREKERREGSGVEREKGERRNNGRRHPGDFLRGFRNSKYALEPQSCVSHSPGAGITKAAAEQYRIV